MQARPADRLRATRLRNKLDRGKQQLTAAELKWLAWYSNKHPSSSMNVDEVEAVEEAAAEAEAAERERAPIATLAPRMPPPPPLKGEQSDDDDGSDDDAPLVGRRLVEHQRASAPLTADDLRDMVAILQDGMRASVNAQVASLEMMERACSSWERLTDKLSAHAISMSEQLVDALTLVAETHGEPSIAEVERDAADGDINATVQKKLLEAMGGVATSTANGATTPNH